MQVNLNVVHLSMYWQPFPLCNNISILLLNKGQNFCLICCLFWDLGTFQQYVDALSLQDALHSYVRKHECMRVTLE